MPQDLPPDGPGGPQQNRAGARSTSLPSGSARAQWLAYLQRILLFLQAAWQSSESGKKGVQKLPPEEAKKIQRRRVAGLRPAGGEWHELRGKAVSAGWPREGGHQRLPGSHGPLTGSGPWLFDKGA